MISIQKRTKRFVLSMVIRLITILPPEVGLKILFRIDNWLYYLQGQLAIAYGGGLHPKHRLTRYHDFFVDRVQPGERVLDIGCGVGAVACDLAEQSEANVVGIDLNPENIAQALVQNSHPHVEYYVGDVLQTVPEGSFDVIVLSNVLEHLSDRPAFLQKTQQLTYANRLLIRVPLFERDWRVPLKRELGIDWRLDPTHEIEYTVQTFANEMEAAGMEIIFQEIHWGEIWAEVRPLNTTTVDLPNSSNTGHG